MKNTRVAQVFRDIADILELKGENVFRVRAYRRAADVIEGVSEDVADLARESRLTDIPGIGEDLAGKIAEIVATGSCAAYEELRAAVPAGLREIVSIPTVGPKTARRLYEELGIKSVGELERAIGEGRLKGIRGIKGKTIDNIAKGIALIKKGKERMPLAVAAETADGFIVELRRMKEVSRISEAGSLRRRKETVRDLDILVTSTDPAAVMERFVTLPGVNDVVARGMTKSTVRTGDGIQVDCRVVEEKSFGAALLYFTGSKNFNIRLRSMAVKKGWKVNEYGVFAAGRSGGEDRERFLAGEKEEDIFGLFGMEYVPPEMREDEGEIELALERRLPRLVTLKQVRGDLHCHSKWSDGGNTIAEMAAMAKSLGYAYMAATDHSQSLKIAHGLDRQALRRKKREIDELNAADKDGFRILFGTEVDIDMKGNIDYPDDILKEFDVVVAAVHTGFKQTARQMTRRLVAACRNKFVHVIAHPTGRLWGAREGYEFDHAEVFSAAAGTNTALEINSFPQRLDLNDQDVRLAKAKGARVAVNTDSHATAHMRNMRLGIDVARRGWLEPDDIINTLPLGRLLKALRK